jgi:hypothetical protein
MPIVLGIGFLLFVAFLAPLKVTVAASSLFILCLVVVKASTSIIAGVDVTFRDCAKGVGLSLFFLAIAIFTAYFSPSWTAFQADRGRDFSVIVDGVSN